MVEIRTELLEASDATIEDAVQYANPMRCAVCCISSPRMNASPQPGWR